MGVVELSNIKVISQKRIQTLGGDVLHGLKKSEDSFVGFGELYFSFIEKNAVKAWKCHTRMTMNLMVPIGSVKFVFYNQINNNTFEFRVEEIGDCNYARITVPPGIWFGFKGLADQQSLIVNLADLSHDTNEVKRLSQSDINYEWT